MLLASIDRLDVWTNDSISSNDDNVCEMYLIVGRHACTNAPRNDMRDRAPLAVCILLARSRTELQYDNGFVRKNN